MQRGRVQTRKLLAASLQIGGKLTPLKPEFEHKMAQGMVESYQEMVA